MVILLTIFASIGDGYGTPALRVRHEVLYRQEQTDNTVDLTYVEYGKVYQSIVVPLDTYRKLDIQGSVKLARARGIRHPDPFVLEYPR